MSPRKKMTLQLAGAALVLLSAWVSYDLLSSRTTHLREFDPNEVARLETAMWRSYYERQRFQLFRQLAKLLRTQYNMPFVRSNLVAFYAAKAAVVFQDGKQRSDYEQALPDLIKLYQAIRTMSDQAFDVQKAARLELEWWIIHRQRAQHQPDDLTKALAELQAELYNVPADRLIEHGRLRAEAMTIRDTKAEQGGVTEQDWARIDELLHRSWQSLHQAVRS